jgi:hypothetical protein
VGSRHLGRAGDPDKQGGLHRYAVSLDWLAGCGLTLATCMTHGSAMNTPSIAVKPKLHL